MKKPILPRFETFARTHKDGSSVTLVRAIDPTTRKIIATRTCPDSTKTSITATIGTLAAELPGIVARKQEAREAVETETENLRTMPLSRFFDLFWSDDSPYLRDRQDAGRPLSVRYIRPQRSLIIRYTTKYKPFTTPLHAASLYLVEAWIRSLRRAGASGSIVRDAVNAIRTPLSWANKRGLIDEQFTLGGIVLPAERRRARGILTRDELIRLIHLETLDIMEPRPRLKGGRKHEGMAGIDIRLKAAFLLEQLAGLRTGEVRGLRWKNIDMDAGRLFIVENHVEGDGAKLPKADSTGIVPISRDLRQTLETLRSIAFRLGRYGPDEYAIFGIIPGRPIAMSTLQRGFRRALAMIGIDESEREKRNLTMHSGRHGAALMLEAAIGATEARKITRHRSIAAFAGYVDHQTAESIDRARDALSIGD